MKTAELDDFMALNDQISALIEAGVPIGVGQEVPDGDLPRMLARINASVARRAGRGRSIEQALEDDDSIPEWYRNLIVSGLQSDDMDAALQEYSLVANSAEESKFVRDSALVYPFVVCGLAYLGMIGFCLFVVPTMESLYVDFRLKPGSGLIVLHKLRATFPYWVAAIPILLLLAMIWRALRRSRGASTSAGGAGLLSAVSGTKKAICQERCAYFAESLASLIENNVPLARAVVLAANTSGEPLFAEGPRPSASPNTIRTSTSIDVVPSNSLPPFLRWALFQSEPAVDRTRALRMAAALYRESSRHSMRRARIIAPIVALVVIGGTVTLLYGLALFVPVTQMLKAVASIH